ncbi:MAG: flagellar M-ring protein FliF [Alphaproteobacteria bacterium]|nr:flagellar M-ring protein FliF [Alphaproteobacteria bacterium]
MNNFLETLKKLGPARLGIMAAVLMGLLIFFIYISMQVSGPKMKMLYKDLQGEDSAAITAKLEEAKIPYDVSGDGETVRVPEKEIGRARLLVAQAGLPNSGSLGYELFDKQSSFGVTSFVQNINQVRALEGELARTVSALEPIRSARVHLVLPQRELFQRESRPASASVFLKMRGGQTLDREQIAGIQSLVASAVPNLKAKNVSIVDSEGNLLANGSEDADTMLSNKAEEAKKNYENHMTRVIEDLVGRTVGYGNVRANVSADLNFDQMSENQEIYNPEGQVVRSTQTVEDKSSETDQSSDSVSVQNNVPGGNADLLNNNQGPSSNAARTEETTNYEISKTQRTLVRQTGEVKKLSIAVLIDGTYDTDKDGNKTYKPRSEQEIKNLTALVGSAIGYDEKRGDKLEVINMQFADVVTTPDDEDKLFGFNRSDVLDAAKVLTVAVMIILVVLLVLQPMVGRLLATEEEGGAGDGMGGMDGMGGAGYLGTQYGQNPALMPPGAQGGAMGAIGGPNMAMLPGGGAGGSFGANGEFLPAPDDNDEMIDMQRVEGRVKASTLKKVEDIISAYPEETVGVLRNWMSQESS